VRGSALNPNQLIHIPSQGSYQISKITVHSDPCPVGKGAAATMARDEDLLPDAPEDLTMEHPVDDMDADQTWPTEEELHGAKQRVRAPRGAGDYQASWFHSIDDEQGAAGGFDEADEDEMGDEEEEDDESDVSEPPEEVILDEDDDDDDAMTEAGGEPVAFPLAFSLAFSLSFANLSSLTVVPGFFSSRRDCCYLFRFPRWRGTRT
jgi:pre-rRNA-processing protein TSR1